jgi:hypothetical protein
MPQAKQVPVKFTETGAVGRVPEGALDHWKQLGYEQISDEEFAAAGAASDPTVGNDTPPVTGDGAYNPDDHSAKDVASHLASLDTATPEGQAEYDRIVAAEKAGQNRSTALPS